MTDLNAQFLREVTTRLERLAGPNQSIDDAVQLTTEALDKGGVIQAFGTGHSEAFAMEIAGRAGGLIATNRIALRTLVLRGGRDISDLAGAEFERDPHVGENLVSLFDVQPNDIFMIASNSGVNGSILGVALAAKARGHKLIAVTSMEHTMRVTPKHPSGKRLSEVADVVIDNLAPFGDSTMELEGGIGVGAVSSLTAAFIAQRITIGVAEAMRQRGKTPPVYISANIPGGDQHNSALENLYGERIRREA
jgi:uncharacterized phosphosugar-binding protein